MAGAPTSLAEVIMTAIRGETDEMYVARPGKVVSYDPVTNTADVQPTVKRALTTLDGERVFEEIPIIPSVPVCWPRAGAMALTLPLEAGDPVLLVFADASTSEWRGTGEMSEPRDTRRHSVGYPFAIPGAFPDVSPLSPSPLDLAARSAGVVLGEHGGTARIEVKPGEIKLGKEAEDFVALAEKVDGAIGAFKAMFDAWIVAPTDGGAALKTLWESTYKAEVEDNLSTAATMTKAK